MTRMVSVFLPNWPIDRLKREKRSELCPDESPFALVDSEDNGLVLTAINASAARQSLYPGLGLADARAICPRLLTAPAELENDAESLAALARWSSRYSPSLNVDGADGLWLDVAGIPHLFGGERDLLADMAKRYAGLGFTVRLALAETLGGAHALARFARGSHLFVPPGKIATALATLPVEGLRLAPDTTRLLRRLGLKRIGQLYDLPRAALERRFHSRDRAEAVLERLDQARGRREEPRKPLLPIGDYAARLPFPEPLITPEGIVAGLDRLTSELCRKLGAARHGARRLSLAVYRADGSTALIEAGLSAACREPLHLLALLQDKIAAIDAGFGVDLMVLTALKTEKLLPAQTAFAGSDDRTRPEPLIDRLANRLPRSAVRRLFPRDSHLPERAQTTRSAFAGLPAWDALAPKPPRPLLLLAEPEPLAVLAQVPEGPPARFTWRRVTRRVVKAEGPERISPEWWRALRTPSPGKGEDGDGRRPSPGGGHKGPQMLDPLPGPPPCSGREKSGQTRDYYRIEDEEGHRYWVFRDGLYQDGADDAPSWFLHGVFG